MDKFRRYRKTISPPTKTQPATSSHQAAGAAAAAAATTTSLSSSTSATTKYTIQQKVPTGIAPKKGPYSVKRTVDPNEVVIKRRIGEGAKPLFSRDELRSKKSPSPKHKRSISSSSLSSNSSSPAVPQRSTKDTPKTQPIKKKSPEKVPYFLDQKREKDRIKRIYGSRRSRSLSCDRRRSSGKNTRNRSRTRSPPSSHSRRYHSSYSRRRTPSRESYRSRHHHHRSDYSRSRSRSRERRRNSYRRRNEATDERSTALPPATQFIPIPVPMEYPYLPPAWGPPMMPQPPRFPFMMRPPIPAAVPFMPRHFRPPRFYMPNGYQRGIYRPRH